jgi:hypothetical protein
LSQKFSRDINQRQTFIEKKIQTRWKKRFGRNQSACGLCEIIFPFDLFVRPSLDE